MKKILTLVLFFLLFSAAHVHAQTVSTVTADLTFIIQFQDATDRLIYLGSDIYFNNAIGPVIGPAGATKIVDGKGYTLDGLGGASKIEGMIINSGRIVTLKDITLQNMNRAVTLQSGNLNISDNVNFVLNSVTVSTNPGGAIYSTVNSIMNFTDSNATFSSNTARTGGAIYNHTSTINFTNSNINFDNNAGEYAAALYNYYYGANISFTGSTVTFSSNTASIEAGAISNSASRMSFTGSTITFSGNTASERGGAIYNSSNSTMTFTNSNIIFDGNIAPSTGGALFVIVGAGGAIYNYYYSSITFTGSNVIFSSNMANFYGGAIYNTNQATVTFTGSNVSFIGNIAASTGGAIYNFLNSKINFDPAAGNTILFRDNYALLGRDIYNRGAITISGAGNIIFGGGIEGSGTITKTGTGSVHFEAGSKNDFGTLTLTEGNVHFSTSSKITTMNIGALGTLTLDVDFLDSSQTGVLYFNSVTINAASKLYINDISAGEVPDETNGVIFYSYNANSGTFDESNIYDEATGNNLYTLTWLYGSYFGGAYRYMGFLTYYRMGAWNTFVSAYKAVNSGGTIILTENAKASDDDDDPFGLPNYTDITIDGDGKTLDSDGRPGLGFLFDGSSATFTNISFENFVSTDISRGGGAVSLSNAIINMTGELTFSGSTATFYGGAIFNDSNSIMTFSGSTVTFSGNTSFGSYGSGGAISNSNNATTAFTGSTVTFIGNTAAGGASYGGAIYNETAIMTFTNGNASFIGNNAANSGGAIFNGYRSAIDFTGSSVAFSSNTTLNSGGAICNSRSIATFTDGNIAFSSNTAGEGGAIYNYNNSTMTFTGSTLIFSSNTANYYGGAIYNASNSTVTFTNGNITFDGNIAASTGGAIYNTNNSVINFDTVLGNTITFVNNSAVLGKDIYNAGGIINMNGTGNIIFGGGIEGSGTINKTGTGNVHFEAGSKTDFGGKFNLTEGNVHFSTSAKISNMEIGASGEITLDVDFIGTLTSVLYFDDIKIDMGSKLYINDISTSSVYGSLERAIFYSVNANDGDFSDSNIYDLATGLTGYELNWIAGTYGLYNYMGILTYYNLGPWNTFVAAYKVVALGDTIELTQSITATTDDENPFGLPGNDNITINGLENTLDSANKAGLGFVFDGSTMTFMDINLINFAASTVTIRGGGVINSSNSIVNFAGDVTFSSNTAVLGGAIYNDFNSTIALTNGDITFDGNVATTTGGAVFNAGNSLTDFAYSTVSFINNTAGYAGGAILSTGSAVNFTGSLVKFENNKTTAAGNMSYSGGAIYNNNSEMTFSGSTVTFSTNTTNGLGGAIYNIGNSIMAFSASEVTFSSNTALNYYGGAVYNANSLIAFTNGNTIFSINGANYGGAIRNDTSTMSFTNGKVSFIGNTARNAGGAIYNQSSSMTFANNDIIFSGNTAEDSGGAIYGIGNSIMSFSASTVTFSSNTATDFSGGAIYSNNSEMTFSGSKVNFSSGTAALYGGAIYNIGNSITTFAGSTVTFSINTAGQGGAIFNQASTMTFANSNIIFESNNATSGGAVFNTNSTMTFINGDITFDGNVAASTGGAIYNTGSVVNFTGSLVTFENNKTTASVSYGGAIYNANNSTITFTNGDIIFDGNAAVSYGGAIYNSNNSVINFNTALGNTIMFMNNSAAFGRDIYNDGGTINISGAGSIIFGGGIEGGGTINKIGTGNVYFEAGSKTDFGGKFNLTEGNVHFSTSAKISNMEIGASGELTLDVDFIGSLTKVLYFDDIKIDTADSKLYINDISTSPVSSGYWAIDRAIFYSVNENSGTFSDNNIYNLATGLTNYELNWIAGTYGAYNYMGILTYYNLGPWNTFVAAYKAVTSGNTINLTYNSTAATDDENPFGLPGDTNITINGLRNTLDSAGIAGLGFVLDGSSITFRDINFENFASTATNQNGGVINSSNSIVNFAGAITFGGNTANIGGAIYGYNSEAAFTNSDITFSGNTADSAGGAIYNSSSTMSFVNSDVIFSSNTADIAGGAIFSSSSTMTFTNGNIIFDGNIAASTGGAINNLNSEIIFTGSTVTFSGNTASILGGAIYNDNSEMTFAGNTASFSSNIASTSGGAIFNDNNSLIDFAYSTISFINNIAGYNGAAIFNTGSVINFTDSIIKFENNKTTASLSLGGAIYNDNNGKIDFTNGTVIFGSNTSSSGGAVYNTAGSTMAFTYSSITFSSNTADIAGGAIRNNIAEMTFTNSNITFSNSRSSLYGGAIYNDNNSTMTFAGSTVTFSINTAGNSGGAVYNDNNSVIDFASTLLSFINNSANFGGAIYAGNNSNTNFGGGEVNFEGNEAGSLGGALYISGSTVSFNTGGGEVLFTGNKANGNANDVYMDMDAILNISGSNTIRFEGGIITSSINVSGIEINKSGPGAIYLGGDSEVWGDFNIIGGDIVMLESATYRGKALELPSGSTLDMENGTVNTIEVEGNFASLTNVKMDVFYDGTNDVIKADTADIDGNIDIFAGVGTYVNKEFQLIITSTAPNLNGVFTSSSISKADSGDLKYELKYDNGIVTLIINGKSVTDFGGLSSLTRNQSETARAFDSISANPGAWQQILNEMAIKQNSGTDSEIAEIKEFLTEASGYFLSNVIRNMAADSPNNEVYDKIKNHREEHKTNSGLWVQLKGGIEKFKKDENSIADYKDTSMGVMFGFDRFVADKFAGADAVWGVYGRINKDNIEQGSGHSADGNKNGLGVYGGYLRDSWELKGMLLGSYDRFSTERMTFGGDKAKADINAFTVSADVEAALRIGFTEVIDFKPYAGIEMQNTMYEGFNETGAGMYNLEVSGGNYLRSAGRVGLGLDYGKDIWTWYANVECKYMLSGTSHEIDNQFNQTGVVFSSRGSEEGEVQIGVGLGGDVRIAQNWKAFANGKYYTADGYENLYGNIGVRYMFGR